MKSALNKFFSACAALWVALFASASVAEIPQEAIDAPIVVLGEQHDNPAHHARQAVWVTALEPKALVFEMLTPDQAAGAKAGWTDQSSLDDAIGWSATEWPSLDMYYQIFTAAPKAAIFGAGVPRDALRGQWGKPLAQHPLAQKFGLGVPLAPQMQSDREALQSDAHCGALPEEMLPMMVDAQRIRDVALANAVMQALSAVGAPVVVITGNGHARGDWGMPALLQQTVPQISVFSLAQAENGGDVSGGFDLTLSSVAPDREDPCAAFAD
jgi:uncharacterized iron-regulated protein